MWKVREREESRVTLVVLIEQLGGQWSMWIEIKEFCLSPVKFEVTSRHPSKDVQESTWIYKFGV